MYTWTAVEKDILFARMAMEITKQKYVFGQDLADVAHEAFAMVNDGMQLWVGILPTPIQIFTGQATSVIAINDTIHIEHWNYFEHEVGAKFICFWSITG